MYIGLVGGTFRVAWFPGDAIVRTLLSPRTVALVNYSSSEDDEEVPGPVGGMAPLLQVPESILNMFPDPEDVEKYDNAAHHGGRIRSFKHERGNWATYVYVPCQPHEEFQDLIENMVSLLAKYGVALTTMKEFHISQSQTVVLRHHWIGPFVQSLKVRLGSMHRFLCIADRIQVYTNSERTRTFLGLAVSVGSEQLLEVVSEVDQSMKEFNLQTFYQDPSFHVSLAWCVGDATGKIEGPCLEELQKVLDSYEDSERLTRFYAEEIRCKAGNKVFRLPLA